MKQTDRGGGYRGRQEAQVSVLINTKKCLSEAKRKTYRRILVVLAGTADASEFAEGRGDAPPLRRGGGRSAALAVGSMHDAAHL